MATTTAALIRDRAIAVIAGLFPRSLIGNPFLAFENDDDGDFEAWCETRPESALRVFQVRTTTVDGIVLVSNFDIEEHYLQLAITIAYPKTAFAGVRASLSRDDVIDQDRHDVEGLVGLRGAATFTPATGADATFRGDVDPTKPRVNRTKTGCDYIELVQLWSFYRSMT